MDHARRREAIRGVGFRMVGLKKEKTMFYSVFQNQSTPRERVLAWGGAGAQQQTRAPRQNKYLYTCD